MNENRDILSLVAVVLAGVLTACNGFLLFLDISTGVYMEVEILVTSVVISFCTWGIVIFGICIIGRRD